MPNVSVPQNIGFTIEVADYLEHYTTQLTAAGLNSAATITALRGFATDLSQLNQEQENLKTGLKNKTAEVDAKHAETYNAASSALDMAIGALGKTTAEGKEGARIRSTLRGRSPSEPTPPTPPAP
jgi:hypothetical protein